MSGAADLDPALDPARLARRVTRLFRAERAGRFDLLPGGTVRRLIERRGALIEALVRLEAQRRSAAAAPPAKLEDALRQLAAEIARCRDHTEFRLMSLADDLEHRRGGARGSGLRDRSATALLGSG